MVELQINPEFDNVYSISQDNFNEEDWNPINAIELFKVIT